MVPYYPLYVRLDSYRDVRIRVHCEETVSRVTDAFNAVLDKLNIHPEDPIRDVVTAIDDPKVAERVDNTSEAVQAKLAAKAKADDLRAQLAALDAANPPDASEGE
jgi:hypothetical protein